MTTPVPDMTGYYPTMDPKYQIKDPTTGDVNPNGFYGFLQDSGALTSPPKAGDVNQGGSMVYDGYNWGWKSYDPANDFDPTLGTNVNYGNGAVENFAQGQNPALFLSAGANYSDTNGMKAAVPGTDLYSQLSADSNQRGTQAIGKQLLIAGGAGLASGTFPGMEGFGNPGTTGFASSTSTGAGTISSLGSEAGGLTGVTIPSSVGYIDPIASVGGSGALSGMLGMTAPATGAALTGIGTGAAAASSGGGIIQNLLGGKGVGSLVGDVAGAVIGSNAANNATNAITDATDKQIGFARENRDIILNMNKPFYDASTTALGRLMDMSGLSGKPVDNKALLESDPSYQFRRDQSMQALESGAAARGGLLSGDFAKNALQLAGNYASQEYSNIYNRIAGIAGYGQQATVNNTNGINATGSMINTAVGDAGAGNASGYVARGNVLMDLASKLGGMDWSKFGSKP